MSISSVRTKSTGFADRAVSYKDVENNNTDASSPHPMNEQMQNPATMGKDCGCEYHERPTSGIEKMGVGSMKCNDAACEEMTTHPTAADLADAGTMGTVKSMRRM